MRKLTVKEIVYSDLKQLIERTQKEKLGYSDIVLNIRNIVQGTPYSWAERVCDKLKSQESALRFLYNLFLCVNGLHNPRH